MSVFWDTILPIMADKRITQVDIAKTLDKDKSTINHWIKFDRIPPADYALKIADYLGEDLRYLITGERSEEVVFQYRNAKLKPVVELLEDKPDEVIEKVYSGALFMLGADSDKKTPHREEAG